MIPFWQKPRDIRIRVRDGCEILCDVYRDPGADRNDGIRVWVAVPVARIHETDLPATVVAGKLPGRTRILVKAGLTQALAKIEEDPPDNRPGGPVTYLP
jgi:hypothetical protein